jgi:peptidoglycan/LPS O-acetylase OafA/YrhL
MSATITLRPNDTLLLPGRKPNAGRERRVMFGVVRLVAVYGIVWLHTPRSSALAVWSALGRFAVAFFVAATIFFIWQSLVKRRDQSLLKYAVSRFQRIYVPFLAWSLIYLVFKAAKVQTLPDQPNELPGLEFLWTGSFDHLWFMPFILAVSVGAFVLGRAVVRRRVAEIATAVVCCVAGLTLAVAGAPTIVQGGSAELAYDALPAVAWGIALAVVYHRGGAAMLQTSASAVAGLLVAVSAMAVTCWLGRDTLAENISGVACVAVALAPWNGPRLAWLARLGPLAYGIYLSHMLLIKSAEALLNRLHAPLTWWLDVTVFVLAATLSTLLAWLLSRSPLTRWLVA